MVGSHVDYDGGGIAKAGEQDGILCVDYSVANKPTRGYATRPAQIWTKREASRQRPANADVFV